MGDFTRFASGSAVAERPSWPRSRSRRGLTSSIWGGRIVMGNWIPNDPTYVAQLLRVSSAYSPPPPEGFVSPMTWGVEENVVERFVAAGVPAENVSCERLTCSSSRERRLNTSRSSATTTDRR
jgi:hypothetical protein